MNIKLLLPFLLTGCVSMLQPKMMSPTELEQRGTRNYAASVEIGLKASAVALRTLGYEITNADATSGMIKTAPRDMAISAAGGTAYRDELGWVLTVTAQGQGIVVRAVPHAYTNGTEVPSTQLPSESMEPKFTTLWNELDQDMKQVASTP